MDDRQPISPSPPFRGEREGPAPKAGEGEVGTGRRSGIPHLTPTLSAPGGGEGAKSAEIREAIRGEALAMGFDAVGFAEARLADAARADLGEFLQRGYHGDMGWPAATAERRGDPQTLWPEAPTIVVLCLTYASQGDPRAV